MSQINKEKLLEKYPLPVTINETEIILKQMKNSICKIENKIGDGTGFFCQLSNLNKKLLITNNHVINEEIIKNNKIINITLNDDEIKKDIKIKEYYTNKDYDTTIIEIDDKDERINYLELDYNILNENFNIYNKSIYIIQYPIYGNKQKAAVSYGVLNGIQDESNLIYYCSTDKGSSGSPIIKLSDKKIIGIHKENVNKFNFNRGTLLKYPINEYLNKLKKNNEIKLTLDIKKEDINKDIYFLDNTDGYNLDGIEHHHDNLKELNESNTQIFINNKKYKYIKSFKPKKEGLHEIKIKFNIKMKDCSYMFSGCSNITNIDLYSFDTKNITNMSCMFLRCSNLTKLDLSSFDTENVTNMSSMFSLCPKLTKINLSYFNTKNVTDMSVMFCYCSNLTNLDLSSFDTKNVTKMNYMFNNCSNLINLDLSSFNTKNVTDARGMFLSCSKFLTVKINNNSLNIINKLLKMNINVIDQFGNKISKNNTLNNINYSNSNNFNNNFNSNMMYIMNNNMMNNDMNNNMMNNMNNNMVNNMNNNMMNNMNNNMSNNIMLNNMTMNNMNNNMNNNMSNNIMLNNLAMNNMMNNNI